MRTVTLARIGLVSASVLLSLIAIWLILLPIRPAQSIEYRPGAAPPPAEPGQATSTPITDTRWLNLLRSTARQSAVRRALATAATLHIHLTDGFVAGRVAAASNVIISVTRAGAEIVHVVTTPFPDGDGYMYLYSLGSIYYICPLVVNGGGYCYFYFQPGDVVWVTQANVTISMTVPELSGLADTTNDTVYGTAPVSQPVTIYLYPFVAPDVYYTRTVTATANGQYRAVWSPALDVRPRDSGYVAYTEAPDRQAYVRFIAPFLSAQNGGPEISGLAAPRNPVVITVTNAAGLPRNAYAYTAPDGSFAAYIDYGSTILTLQPGDRIVAVSAGQAFSMTVMPITAQSDLVHRQVRGEAAPGQLISLVRFTGPLACCGSGLFWDQTPAEQATVTATIAGQYTATLALARPNYGAAIVTSAEGYQTYARFAVPYLSAQMGSLGLYSLSYWVSGQVDEPSAPITIAIQGPSGYFKDLRHVSAGSDGYFSDSSYYGLTLDSGDVITVTTPRGVQAALTLPHLTGEIDSATDIVSGTAPPGARLTVTVNEYGPISPPFPAPTKAPGHGTGGGGPANSSYTVIVTATAQGTYQVNLHDVIDLTRNATGSVAYVTPDGNLVTRIFLADSGACQVDLQEAYVGGNLLRLATGINCRQSVNVALRLRDAQGQLKFAQQFTLYPYNQYDQRFFLYSGLIPIYIMPGDVIEIQSSTQPILLPPVPFPPTPTPTFPPPPKTSGSHAPAQLTGDQFVTYKVPTLTVSLDPATDVVNGQAPAASMVTLHLYREWDLLRVLTATVSAQGEYSINLSGLEALTAGDRALVSYAPDEQPNFSAWGVIPLLRVQLHEPDVSGWLPPLTPFTATLNSAGVITAVANGYSDNEGYFSTPLAPFLPGDTIVVTTPQQAMRLAMPFLSAQIERNTATVSGQAPPNAHLQVVLNYRSQVVTATASGIYAVSFVELAPLSSARGTLTYFDANGNQVLLDFATPRWTVYLDERCVNGTASMAGIPITLTLRSQNGTFKGVLTTTSQSTSGYFTGCFTSPVQSTDRLLLSPAMGAVSTFTVPILTARHDYARQVLKGSAPANTELLVSFGAYSAFDRHTRSGAAGNYGLDTSDLNLPLNQEGSVILNDETGSTTYRSFTVTGFQWFFPVIRQNR